MISKEKNTTEASFCFSKFVKQRKNETMSVQAGIKHFTSGFGLFASFDTL